MHDRHIEFDALTRPPEELSVKRLNEVVRYLRELLYQARLRKQNESELGGQHGER